MLVHRRAIAITQSHRSSHYLLHDLCKRRRVHVPKDEVGVAKEIGNALEKTAGLENERGQGNLGEVHAGTDWE